MDRRSLLAVVATILVLLGWQLLFIAPKQKEMARKRARQLREKSVADSLAALEGEKIEEDAPEIEAAPEAEAVEEVGEFLGVSTDTAAVELVVVTDRMRVELSSAGGEITSVKLLEFEKKDGGPVELIPEGRSGLSLSFLVDNEWERPSRLNYETTVNGYPGRDGEEVLIDREREEVEVAFRMVEPEGAYLEKKFTFRNGGYEVGLAVTIKRGGRLQETDAYAVSWDCGMAVTEADAAGDRRQFAAMGKVGEEFYKESLGKFGKTEKKKHEGTLLWAGARTKYFLSAIIPLERREGALSMLGNKAGGFVGYSVSYPFRGDPQLVEDKYTCYLGPLDMTSLKAYGIGLEKTIDLGWMRFFSAFILKFMIFLRRFIPNYGVIIIIMSVITKVLFYRLTHKSFKSMKDMQRLQPKIKELQEKYKENKEKLNQEMMKLYKEAGVNPLGGCLPLLLQMPVFIALYSVLRNTIEIRNAPFVLWIDDLSSPDVLFSFGTSLPFLGSEFHLLPILMGGAMVLQSKLGGSTQTAQTKMMSTMMPIIFTFFFYSVPSGLVLYWLVNTVLSIVQQYYAHREVEKEDNDGEGETAVSVQNEKGQEKNNDVKPPAGKASKRQKKTGGKQSRKNRRRTYH